MSIQNEINDAGATHQPADNKSDITGSEDIVLMVNAFYDKIRQDELLGPIFDDIAGVNWDIHLPRMYGFWEAVLLSKAGYKGNPVKKHVDLTAKVTLESRHFDRWIHLFNENVDAYFAGPGAEYAKERAGIMSQIMLHKCTLRQEYALQITPLKDA